MATQEYVRTKEGSTIGKIVVDRDLCIAAVSCIAVADTTFELDAENKVVVKEGGANAADDATLIMSAESCPTKAILLYGTDGTKIFPKD
jgi:ferredoxin